MGAAVKMTNSNRIAKAESWLTEWADAQIRGEDVVNGYANQSNLKLVTDMGFKVGGQCSKPLIHGYIGFDVVKAVDAALSNNMSKRQVKACIALFAPGRYSHEQRISVSNYCKKGYWNLRHAALDLVMKIKF